MKILPIIGILCFTAYLSWVMFKSDLNMTPWKEKPMDFISVTLIHNGDTVYRRNNIPIPITYNQDEHHWNALKTWELVVIKHNE